MHWPSRYPSGPLRPRKNPLVLLQAVKVALVSRVGASHAMGSRVVVRKVVALAAKVSVLRFHPSSRRWIRTVMGSSTKWRSIKLLLRCANSTRTATENSQPTKFVRRVPRVVSAVLVARMASVALVVLVVLMAKARASAPVHLANNSTTEIACSLFTPRRHDRPMLFPQLVLSWVEVVRRLTSFATCYFC